MDWTELTIQIPVAQLDEASDIASMVVPYGFYVEDYSDLEQGAREIAHIDLIDETLLQKDRQHALIHIYISPEENPAEAAAYLRDRYEAAGIAYSIALSDISEEDWANNWKQYFHPTEIGEKLLILPGWLEAPETSRRILKIDPGAAFGTGTHATTRLCMETLERCIRSGDTVLDIGCGSGILSIAAILLGAACATGVDIDPLAVKTAAENGAVNGLTPPAFRMLQGDLADCVTGVFDVCVANIVADVILRLCENVRAYLAPGGLFVASGIIDSREDEVAAAIAACGLEPVGRYERGGWVCLVGRNPA